MLGEVWTATLQGVEGVPVRVEAQVSTGIPGLFLVGLPRGAAREGRDRVQSALRGVEGLSDALRITLNLAPADLVKDGSALDLAMAVAVLVGAGRIPVPVPNDVAFLGELGLDGRLHSVPGLLPLALGCLQAGFRTLVLPAAGGGEVEVLRDRVELVGVRTLAEAVRWAAGKPPEGRPSWEVDSPGALEVDGGGSEGGGGVRGEGARGVGTGLPPGLEAFTRIRGQAVGKRALEVAAAGGHGLLLVGPPGAGKTLLAQALPGLLPPLDEAEALEVTAIHSAAGLLPSGGLLRRPPFRAPHHGASRGALVGGGSPLRPGEVTLAHRGVLFLDELPHWESRVLESLREPLESGVVDVIRTGRRARFPARFLLVAAMNPCPCGLHTDPDGRCRCEPSAVTRYQGRLSGPLLDRMDLRLSVLPPLPGVLLRPSDPAEARRVRDRVAGAREAARAGMALTPTDGEGGREPLCSAEARAEMEAAALRRRFSPRGVVRTLRVARTLALLEGADQVGIAHVREALHFREGGAA